MFGTRWFSFRPPPDPPPTKGNLFAWGENDKGQLGIGSTGGSTNSPVQVGALTDWNEIGLGESGASSYGIRDGKAYGWGWGGYGQLGLGNWNDTNSPTQVGALTTWTKVNGGYGHSLRIIGGKLYSCGYNDKRQLGVADDNTNRNSPTQVGTATDWQMVSGGNVSFSFGIRSGMLFAWGDNLDGELGLGGVWSYQYPPAQVGTGTDWTYISSGFNCGMGIRGGKLYSWGWNTYGQLGLGDTSKRSSPVQVGSATDWDKIWLTQSHALGIRSGKLFAWGNNQYGQLGLGDLTNRSSPVQVGSATDWTDVPVDGYSWASLAIRSGKLYAWGYNNFGQLGLGDTNPRSSPVQVGSSANWIKVASGDTSLGIKY